MAMENPFEGKEIWFGVGSQDLYGEEALRQVAQQTGEIVDFLNNTGKIPAKIVLKPTLKSSDGVKAFMTEASANPNVIGVITGATPSPRPRCGSVASKCLPSRCCSWPPSTTRKFRGRPSTWTS